MCVECSSNPGETEQCSRVTFSFHLMNIQDQTEAEGGSLVHGTVLARCCCREAKVKAWSKSATLPWTSYMIPSQ